MLNTLMMPAVQKQGQAEQALAVQRRMAMQMTVLGQVHLARLQYENAARVLDRSSALANADRKIEKYTIDAAASGTQSQAEMVAAQTISIISEMRRYQAIAQVYAANGRLQASLGFEPNLGDIQNTSLEDLTAQVAQAMAQWQTGERVKEEAAEIERSAQAAPEKVVGMEADKNPVSPPVVQPASPARVALNPVATVQTVNVTEPVYQPLSWNNAGELIVTAGQ